MDAELNSASNEYPIDILLTDLATPKQEITEKNVMMMSLLQKQENHQVFSGISYFWGSGVHQKYAGWVLVGCRI